MDYDWPNNETRQLFPSYKQEDNLPLGLEVAGNRLFITVPRWKPGVAASLNYIMLNGQFNAKNELYWVNTLCNFWISREIFQKVYF